MYYSHRAASPELHEVQVCSRAGMSDAYWDPEQPTLVSLKPSAVTNSSEILENSQSIICNTQTSLTYLLRYSKNLIIFTVIFKTQGLVYKYR